MMHTARTTSGQPLSITYDAVTNTVRFHEYDWHADPVRSGGATSTAAPRRPQPVAIIRRRREVLRRGRAAA